MSASPTGSQWLNSKSGQNRLKLGISFNNLSVHGHISGADVQLTVSSYAFALPRLIRRLISPPSDSKVQILHGISGLVQSGEMLLVLGRPGSGCTTLLKTLATDTHGILIDPEAQLNYSGITVDRIRHDFKGETIYLAELDVHFPELTLGQTLSFAALTRYAGHQQSSIAQNAAKELAHLFNLGKSFDTWIGNAMIRGVSGGEKRRTSIAEALISGAQLQCWDNSTRGLDSATAHGFVDVLRQYTNKIESTVVMSIYQASEKVFKTFDKVTLLYQGRQIYFGPVYCAEEYFYQLGFQKPARATTPDFLTSITNPAERIVRPGFENIAPRSPDDFARVWQASDHYRKLLVQIGHFNTKHPMLSQDRGGKLSLRTSTYVIPIASQIAVCLKRGIQRLKNQPAPVIGSILANAILAVVIGSVFFNLPTTADNMDKRAVLVFFSLLLTAFSPAFELLTIWAQRPIVEKHARYGFYHSFTDAAASMICDLPNKILTAMLFQSTLYFMTNLHRTAGAFFIWFAFNFVLVLNMSMWFRFVGSVSRTMEQTTAPTCILVILSCIYAGFIVPVPSMVQWLQWFRRGNPIAYAYESLMINEFQGRKFSCKSMIPIGSSYNAINDSEKVCPVIGAVNGQSFVDGDAYLVDKFEYRPVHLWRNFGILVAMTIIVCAFHLIAAEFVPAQRSKGDMLRFKEQKSNCPKQSVADRETGNSITFAQDRQIVDVPAITPKEDLREKLEHGIVRQSSVLNWQDLTYDVKAKEGKKRILNSVNGWVKPGTLTALMGVTGAGKTTLLDVLADRVNQGSVTDSICVDSIARDASFQRKTGYAQQEDIHLPTTTVREALEFSASLRQPSTESAASKTEYVNKVLDFLDMATYANAIVGVPGDGLNIEQRKRCTIGVELAARPELLIFLDEPTSGLDSQTAWSICTLLRKLADSGQAVLCTIHQPSSQLFRMFDRLLLLSDKGETIYFGDIGPNASTLISYLERHGAPACSPDSNPAEWMLDVTNSKNQDQPGKGWAEAWNISGEKQQVAEHLSEIRSRSTVEQTGMQEGHYATSWIQQMTMATKRIFQEYWRSPVYLYSKLALCAGVAIFNGLSFQNITLDIQGVTSLIFSAFLLTQMFGTVDQQVIPRFVDGRALFEARERNSKTYSWTAFIASNVLVELVWQTVASVLVFVAWYYPTGMWRNGDATFSTAERGGLCFMTIWLFGLWIVTFSQAAAVGLEFADSAVQLATLIFWFSLVFCGVLVYPADLPKFWIFVYRASPLTYFINGLVGAGLANTKIACSARELLTLNPSPKDLGTSCQDYLADFIATAGGYVANPDAREGCQYCTAHDTNHLLRILGIGTSNNWNNVGYLAVFILFNILATFGLYWLARVPKSSKGKGK